MSDEEKEAIEHLNKFKDEDCFGILTAPEHLYATILNLIEKQSKEIEELKEEQCCMTTCLRKDKEKLFLEDLKNGKIILADIEKTEEGTKYYYIQKIC